MLKWLVIAILAMPQLAAADPEPPTTTEGSGAEANGSGASETPTEPVGSRPHDDTAEAHRLAGNAYIAAHDYGAAVTFYRNGYARDPWPLFLYNIGLAERANGDCRAAIVSFREFATAVASREPTDPYRIAGELQLTHAHEHVTELEAVCSKATVEQRYKLSLFRRPVLLGGISASVLALVAGGVFFAYAYQAEHQAQAAAVAGTLGQFEADADSEKSRRQWGVILTSAGAAGVITTLAVHWLSPRWTTVLKIDTNSEHAALSLAGRF